MSQPDPTDAPVVRTALVVDDSAAARHRAATLLRLGGWQVVEAVGTDAALRMAAIVEFDLVVTEMAMRNGHGATLMRKLRENGTRARLLVTATRRTHQVRSMAASAGAVACLAKPVDPRLFVDVLRGLAPVVRRPAEAPAPSPHRRAGARRGDVRQRAAAPARCDRERRARG
ncbi:response regulator [Blastococcus brunescens]|uniref:Response regulator n=1 Tax=Blastococcus brunescens TaxID=1564165 RepID=A0ABZ1B6Y3_9ACTN|nr:response regulator [Blastococcus sp. BMG 8361]WRL65149.1 response regulator [Blastococcus sp. BMG 8361]